MDRTIFVNIAHFIDAYDMEMHTIHSISRNAESKETLINIENQKRICIPMNSEDHNNFMKAVYTNQDIWFSYIGYIEILNLEQFEDKKRQHLFNEKLYRAIYPQNQQIAFSVISGKTNI